MQMGVMEQILAPGVKDAEKADFGAQMFGIGGDSAQRLRRGLKENAVDHSFVLVSNGGDLFRHCKDDMEVLAVAIVGNALVTAVLVIAFFDVAAEGCRPADLDRTHDASLGSRQRTVMFIAVRFAIATEDLRPLDSPAVP